MRENTHYVKTHIKPSNVGHYYKIDRAYCKNRPDPLLGDIHMNTRTNIYAEILLTLYDVEANAIDHAAGRVDRKDYHDNLMTSLDTIAKLIDDHAHAREYTSTKCG